MLFWRDTMCNHFIKSKAGQGGPNTGVLIGLIGLLIIAYILFLPAETRQELLTENTTNITAGTEKAYALLLNEQPGKLEPSSIYDKYSDGHSVADAFIKVTRNAAVLKSVNPFYVKNSIFGSSSKSVTFSISNVDTTDNVLLSFAVNSHSGRLIIKLNGQEIYNNEISSYNPNPIELPKELLVNNTNVLEFSVSGPGIAFWRENSYELLDIKITGYITDLSMRSSRSSFDITSFERNNVEKYTLSFYVDCASASAGKMSVGVNDRIVAEFVPDCGSPFAFDLAPSYFVTGQNEIIFSADAGKYSIQRIKIVPSFKEIQYPIYYFDIKDEEFSKIANETLKVRMRIRFADESNKEFNFRINSIIKRVDISEFEYTYEFPKEELLKGNNALKIEPISALDISELKVEYFNP